MKKRKLIPISKSCTNITESEVRKYATFLTADDSNVDCNKDKKPNCLCGRTYKEENNFSQLECTNSRSNIVDPCRPELSPKQESNYVPNKNRKRPKDFFSCKSEKINEPEPSYVAEYRKCEYEELDKLIRFRKTPEQLKEHREALDYLCLERKKNIKHEASEIPDETTSVIELDSFIANNGKTKKRKSKSGEQDLQYASASSSEEKILFLSDEVLELRNPKSGTIINETIGSQENLPFSSYDPRKLQCTIGAGPYTIKNVCAQNYVKVPDFTDTEYSATVPTYDPTVYHISRAKIFKVPYNKLLQKGTMLKKLFQATRAIENEEYCQKSFRRPKSIATIYCAYVTLFTIHPKFWSVEIMDSILNEGETHWFLSTKTNYQNPNGDFDLNTYIKNLDAAIRIKPIIQHQIEKPPNLLKVLTMVFQHYFSIIFLHQDLYLLITKKTEDSFYVFDPNSRTSQFNRDPSHGRAILFTVQSVEGLLHLLYNYNSKKYPDKYIGKKYRIYEIGLATHRFQKKPPAQPLSTHRKKKYCILNRFCAIITGTVGIDVPVYTTDENASILVVYIAMLYASINAPSYWSPRTVNALIHYGGQYYMTFVKLKGLEKVFINDLPLNVVLGAFSGDIKLTPYYESGFLEDASSYRRSPMRKALLKYFRNNSKAILQIDNTYLGIWTDKKKFFYVFDPFARGHNGLVVPPPYKGIGGVLQMHCKFDSMCRLVYMIAIKVITRGYYYLHGYKLNAINPLTTNKYLRTSSCGSSNGSNYFDKLYILYPNPIDLRAGIKEREKSGGDEIEIAVPLECLSNLSVRPCQRANSERDFINKQKLAAHSEEYVNALERSFSMKTLKDYEKVFTPDSEIVTELVLSDILDSVDHCLNTIEEKFHDMGIRATAVLLKTDIDNLNDMAGKIRIGKVRDDVIEKLLSEPTCYMRKSKKDENIPTNYIKMINGIEILWGKPIVQADESDEELLAMLTRGVTSAYAAIICASKYDISTWNSETVNSILSIGEELQLKFQDANAIQTLLNNKFPPVKIGVVNFTTTTKLLGFFEAKNMYDMLKKSCNCYKKFIIIFSSFNFAFIVRHNVYYLFFGLPCDEFGFRTRYSDTCDDKKTNRACVLKIYSLKAVIDRILFDRMDRLDENFMLVSVVPHKSIEQLEEEEDEDDLSINIGNSEVNREVIMRETIRKKKIENHIESKLFEMEEVIQKECTRIKWFYDLKKQYQPGNKEDQVKLDLKPKSNEPTPAKKHPVKGKFKETPPLHDDNDMEDKVFGLVEDKDGSFKLQGNANLTDFYRQDFRKIKACHFASVYAILQSIILPIHKWRPSNIDQIINKAETLYSRVDYRDIRPKRFITNLQLDQYTFDICITLAQQYNKNQTHIKQTFYKILKKNKYFLMQTDQATFAIYYDKFFHLFIPYSLQQTLDDNEDASQKKKKDENDDDEDELCGAGWIIFPNVGKLQEYLTTLSGDTCWETHYNIYFVEIMKFKENSSIIKANNFMKQPFKPINMTDKGPQDRNMWSKITGEKLSWMSPCMPIWSRKMKRLDPFKNEIGNKYKAFDIEIPDELYSLFGTIHPMAATFCSTRGKQYLATHVLSCCIAHLYRVTEWNSFLLDTIVIQGDRYHQESFKSIKDQNFEITIEHLNTSYKMENFKFGIDIRKDAYGIFFCHPNSDDFNLAKALRYFFEFDNRYGVLTFEGRSIAFGLANKGYFLYDCQSNGHPLFRSDEGASYCLLCNTLHRLIYCIMLAINIRKHIEFVIYSVHIRIKKTSKNSKNECEKSKKNAINVTEAREAAQEAEEEEKAGK